MTKRTKTILVWALLLFAFYAVYSLVGTQRGAPFDAEQFTAALAQGQVREIERDGHDLLVTLHDGTVHLSNVTIDSGMRELIEENELLVQVKPPFPWLQVVLPALVFLGVVVYFMRRSKKSGASFLNLRNSTARQLQERPKVRFADVGGAEDAKARLADVVDYLRDPARWKNAGARLPRGVLLEGPPGCGKTLLARALAGETQRPYFEVSAAEFVDMFVGVGASRVRDLFERAAKAAPAVVFIDELDAVGRRRGANQGTISHDERDQTLNQLLVCLDGFDKGGDVVVVAATNRSDVLDKALLRPGRFDVRVKIPAFSLEQRLIVLRLHTRTKSLGEDVDLEAIAAATSHYSGADLESLTNDAAMRALSRSRQGDSLGAKISQADLLASVTTRSDSARLFDALDTAVVDSASQLTQPTGRIVARAIFSDNSSMEGDLIWADASFVKLRRPDGSTALIAKSAVRSFDALAGTELQSTLVADAWAGRSPGAV